MANLDIENYSITPQSPTTGQTVNVVVFLRMTADPANFGRCYIYYVSDIGDEITVFDNYVWLGNSEAWHVVESFFMPSYSVDFHVKSYSGSPLWWFLSDEVTTRIINATQFVSIQVAQGMGSVKIYKNGVYQGIVSSGQGTERFAFVNGDIVKFEFINAEGYVFEKFCDSGTWCTTANPYQLTITGGYSFRAYFKQAGPVLNQITIPSTKSVIKNNSVLITATCKDTTGAGMTCPTLTWSKSNNNVDIVPWSNNVDLTIIGVSVGTCVITAIGGGKFSNNCTVTITESAGTLNQIIITNAISIVKGDTGSVSVTCKDTLGYNMTCPTLTWNSSNTSVATVVGGMITGVNVGTSTVTATGGGKTSNGCIVTVTAVPGENVAVSVDAGVGTTTVYKNGTSIGTVSNGQGVKNFTFTKGDTAKFGFAPGSGYVFEKFCNGDGSWCTTANPYQLTIAGGYLFKTFFKTSTCTTPKYKCVNNVCTSDNCDGSGTFPDSNCGTGCGTADIYYRCDNTTKKCVTDSTITGNRDGCSSAGQTCSGGEICPSGQTKDASGKCVCIDNSKMPIFGTCYKKNYVYIVAGAVVLMMMMKK